MTEGATMRALTSAAPGGPDSLLLADLPVPEPGPGQVRVAVRAVGVNYPDTLIIADRYQFRPPRPFAPGGEMAGVVDAVGPDVTAFQPGDPVFGLTGWGAMAEYVVVDGSKLAPVPDGMDMDTAAGFIMTYGTTIHALVDRAALAAGETLLVLGAAGGVGLAAVELGAAMGARVVAGASSPNKAALAREAGAARTFVYPARPDDPKTLADLFKRESGGATNVVYGPVGGLYTEAAVRALGWRGRHLVVGFPAGIPQVPANLLLLKGASMVGVFWGAFAEREAAANAHHTATLIDHWRHGRIRPRVSAIYPLERGGEAIAALANRQAVGKLVVRVA